MVFIIEASLRGASVAAESLLSRLVDVYGPPRVVQPHGPSLVIPNALYTHVLSEDLEKAGLRSFSGVSNGKVAWIVPLNQHRTVDPPGEAERCRFGRLWTREEDRLLLNALEEELSYRETGRKLAAQLDRTPKAIETRLQKLAEKKRLEKAATPEPPGEEGTSVPKADLPSVPLDVRRVASRLDASLHLAEDPRHLPAIRVLLSRALQLLQG